MTTELFTLLIEGMMLCGLGFMIYFLYGKLKDKLEKKFEITSSLIMTTGLSVIEALKKVSNIENVGTISSNRMNVDNRTGTHYLLDLSIEELESLKNIFDSMENTPHNIFVDSMNQKVDEMLHIK
jgi:hypothetical protein